MCDVRDKRRRHLDELDDVSGEPLPVRPESAGWVYLDELSPELNELLANTPTLTDADIEELAEANRWLGIPWWKRLFTKPNKMVSLAGSKE